MDWGNILSMCLSELQSPDGAEKLNKLALIFERQFGLELIVKFATHLYFYIGREIHLTVSGPLDSIQPNNHVLLKLLHINPNWVPLLYVIV